MKASELITILQESIKDHGDLEIFSKELFEISGIYTGEPDDYTSEYDLPKHFFTIDDFE